MVSSWFPYVFLIVMLSVLVFFLWLKHWMTENLCSVCHERMDAESRFEGSAGVCYPCILKGPEDV